MRVSLAIVTAVAGVLFFPLTGEMHTENWSANQPFDIAKIQTVEKNREDFKILMFTDTQLWADLGKNKECYEQMDSLVETLINDYFNIDRKFVMYLRDYRKYIETNNTLVIRTAPKTRFGISNVYNEIPVPLHSDRLVLNSANVIEVETTDCIFSLSAENQVHLTQLLK